ncbi:hypothetical protein [Nocardia wallacei]|uniref:hypothetical protein n=1 Tax=Nocardia wallacei TaxID=480035 RepID=UPI00245619AB|nr:hypothetical protein [Nocardia wallacei]
MIGPKDVRTRDLPDPDGSRFGVPTYYWNTAPAELGMTTRQLAALDPPMRPGDRTEIAGQVLRPRANGREPLAAYLYPVENAVPKQPAHPGRLAGLEKGRRTQQLRAMQRRGIDPAAVEHGEIGDPGAQWEQPEAPEPPDMVWQGFDR